jgi:hypothetical protein
MSALGNKHQVQSRWFRRKNVDGFPGCALVPYRGNNYGIVVEEVVKVSQALDEFRRVRSINPDGARR